MIHKISSFIAPRLVSQVILFALLALLVSKVHADDLEGMPSGHYPIDLTHASVIWKVSHFGFSNYVGRFNDFDATLALDASDFTNSSVEVEIDVASLDTDFPYPEEEDFNAKLIKDWFKSADHPSITFVSTGVSELVDNQATVTGNLT
ncbi:MAG: YceI family protein, partial [Pseudomonadota bacterium]